jgi:predicted TIM-barrel fold metal-dependent hydrolase
VGEESLTAGVSPARRSSPASRATKIRSPSRWRNTRSGSSASSCSIPRRRCRARLERALGELKLRGVALFPAMHKYRLDDECVDAVFRAAQDHRAAVFAHCGVLTVGVRKKLGLPSPFDLRLGDPLSLSAMASRYPRVPVIIPHFGAGYLREALMAADQCPNVHLDTSSSNSWMKYYPGPDAGRRVPAGRAGRRAERLLFGTDSSFFPRGWQRGIYDAQLQAMERAGGRRGPGADPERQLRAAVPLEP